MPAKRAFREGWSEHRFHMALEREFVAAPQISHAKWAAKQLARNMIRQHNREVTRFELEQLRLYGVQDQLMPLAELQLRVGLIDAQRAGYGAD